MRLIDADKLGFLLNQLIEANEKIKTDEANLLIFAYKLGREWVNNMKPVDAVPVVRCKDCKWAEDTGPTGLYCNHPDGRNTIYALPEEFCDCGERKEPE